MIDDLLSLKPESIPLTFLNGVFYCDIFDKRTISVSLKNKETLSIQYTFKESDEAWVYEYFHQIITNPFYNTLDVDDVQAMSDYIKVELSRCVLSYMPENYIKTITQTFSSQLLINCGTFSHYDKDRYFMLKADVYPDNAFDFNTARYGSYTEEYCVFKGIFYRKSVDFVPLGHRYYYLLSLRQYSMSMFHINFDFYNDNFNFSFILKNDIIMVNFMNGQLTVKDITNTTHIYTDDESIKNALFHIFFKIIKHRPSNQIQELLLSLDFSTYDFSFDDFQLALMFDY